MKTTTIGRGCYGGEWWIYSTAITPESDEEWAALWATLDPAYDHESVIGQPVKFAEALGRMVAEQLGPQGKGGWLRSSLGDVEGEKISRPTQWVLHGPMVYSDQLYETLARESDEAARIAALLLAKSSSHAAMREYRFAVLRDGAVDDKVLLKISGMMRDALGRTRHGLVRPTLEARVGREGTRTHASANAGTRVEHWRESTTRTVVRRAETRSGVMGPDGRVVASDSASGESVEETTETRDVKPEAGGVSRLRKRPVSREDPPVLATEIRWGRDRRTAKWRRNSPSGKASTRTGQSPTIRRRSKTTARMCSHRCGSRWREWSRIRPPRWDRYPRVGRSRH